MKLVVLFLVKFIVQIVADTCVSDACGKQKYVVYLGGKGEAESVALTSSHHSLLSDVLGSEEEASKAMVFSYTHSFSGFAAWLTNAQAKALSSSPGVVSVFKSEVLQVQTTRSWSFIGLDTISGSVNSAGPGEDIIIGVLDTGIWPESASFDDHGMSPVPARWKGSCINNGVKNESEKVHCNKKLIGARSYTGGNARDYNGHGTHTSSTAAGRLILGENLFGLGIGNATGGVPNARIAMYKACDNTGGCSDDAILAAFDDAVHDGVDILSLSIGTSEPGRPFDNDSIAIGSFHAAEKGIIVSCAAGNDGPRASTISNSAPWIFTAGASTIDRDFSVAVTLGNGKTVQATALSLTRTARNIRILSGLQAMSKSGDPKGAQYCDTGNFDPKKVDGSVIVCLYPQIASRNTVIANLMDMKAAGVILGSISRGNVFYHFEIPGGTVPMHVYDEILTYLNTTSNATVSIDPTTTVNSGVTAPAVVGFSSRGPSLVAPDILKPDFTAPGVNILASWSLAAPVFYKSQGDNYVPAYAPYNIVSGTSMACPHVTGAAAVLKSKHPTWSPATVKSALITTAKSMNNKNNPIKDADEKDATFFTVGAGNISPMDALSPGLVYDISSNDYVNYLCASGKYDMKKLQVITGHANITCDPAAKDLNYPSVAVPTASSQTLSRISRTLTNVGVGDSVYRVTISAPPGVDVTVEPAELHFTSIGQKLSFVMNIKVNAVLGGWVFGCMTWSDGSSQVRSPLAFK